MITDIRQFGITGFPQLLTAIFWTLNRQAYAVTEPILITERLDLFDMTLSDWADFHELQSSAEVQHYVRVPESEKVIREKFELALKPWTRESDGWCGRVIRVRKSQAFVGIIGFRATWALNEQAEVGYAITPSQAGNGYATESLRALVKIAFQEYDFHKITAIVNAENLPSRRVLEKVGFQQEGRLRDNLKMRNRWYDELYFGLFPRDADYTEWFGCRLYLPRPTLRSISDRTRFTFFDETFR